ncbi:MAG: cytochrome c/FTR1 family iron permease, partial [Emcibacteraceae bacterium]|nr:cytochrome c/FTR1 family iron permease [Emcibacteraceae bacterium]
MYRTIFMYPKIILPFAATLFMATSTISYAQNFDRIVQLIEYVGVDYSEAISNGEVVNENEYAEMVEFANIIEDRVTKLPSSSAVTSLQIQSRRLQALIGEKAPVDKITIIVNSMRDTIFNNFNLIVSPVQTPDLLNGRMLYEDNCVACHGLTGRGNGPLAEELDPKPTDFTDKSRFAQRSLYGLFNTVTQGVEGTSMAEFSDLPVQHRWDLVTYIGRLAVVKEEALRGKKLWNGFNQKQSPISLSTAMIMSPNEAAKKWENGFELMAYLRTAPEALFKVEFPPALFAFNHIQLSYKSYLQGDVDEAYELALIAYLEGFELIEASLAILDPSLLQRTEKEMLSYRSDLQQRKPIEAVGQKANALQSLLTQVQDRLSQGNSLTLEAAFITSFVILLREGLEALLVVVAIYALLVKSGRENLILYLHIGWVGALLFGVATWVISEHLIQISGATREVTEGIAALAASGMLLVVGYWLHSKTTASGWQAFIRNNLESALNKRTLWGLTGLSFISVYREVFETILFYQALWAQSTPASSIGITSGFLVGLLLLIAIALTLIKYSVKLPLGQFFSFTGILLLCLSFVFAGKGIAALQEAGKISSTLIDFVTFDWLGIFPTIEGLAYKQQYCHWLFLFME